MDRQDLDALLIGALYGELTPADESRLAAHLESHPGDRGALDDLKVTRQAVLESRIFALQVEPPQAVSALLLQEAHRRAPKRAVVTEEAREGWFYRFTRVFLAHPAMAAAAMLVLVLGGATLMTRNKGSAVATKEISAPAAQDVARDQQVAAAPSPTSIDQGAAGAGSAYGADLYEGKAADEGAALDVPAEKAPAADKAAMRDRADSERRADTETGSLKKQAQHGIAVSTSKGAPLDFDDAKASSNGFGMAGDGAGRAPGGAAGGGAGTGTVTSATRGESKERVYAQPPPPPANAEPSRSAPATGALAGPTATITATTPPSAPEPKKAPAPAPAKVASKTTIAKDDSPRAAAAPKEEAKPADSTLYAWAKAEHARAVTLAQKGECSAAAKVALGVSTRANDYYAQYMSTDRALKQCAQYIAAEREKSAKAAASKATTASETAK